MKIYQIKGKECEDEEMDESVDDEEEESEYKTFGHLMEQRKKAHLDKAWMMDLDICPSP